MIKTPLELIHFLSKHKLKYLPQAHTYLKINGELFDMTRFVASETNFMDDLIFEEDINSVQVLEYKRNLHQDFLKKWIKDQEIHISFEEIWSIREEGIEILS